jgi:hypothetical protein
MGRGEIDQPIPRGERREEPGNTRQFITDLIQHHRLNVGDINKYYDSWVHLQTESAGYIPKPLEQTIRKVSLGLGFLFYDQWAETDHPDRRMQGAFQKRLQRWNDIYEGQLVLTHEEGLVLRDAAAAVNVAYDPGGIEHTPENIKKRTFIFADLEGIPPKMLNVVDADR